jgi:hypothetical protein
MQRINNLVLFQTGHFSEHLTEQTQIIDLNNTLARSTPISLLAKHIEQVSLLVNVQGYDFFRFLHHIWN